MTWEDYLHGGGGQQQNQGGGDDAWSRYLSGADSPVSPQAQNELPTINLPPLKTLRGQAGVRVGAGVVDAPATQDRAAAPEPPQGSMTPLSDAYDRTKQSAAGAGIFAPFIPLIDAVAREAGGAINSAWGKTEGDEVGAIPFSTAVSGMPLLGLTQKMAETTIPAYREASKTPLRDIPGVGLGVRALEAAGGVLNAGNESIGTPVASATAINREMTPQNVKQAVRDIPSSIPVFGPMAQIVNQLWGKDNPELFANAGMSPQEAQNLARGFLLNTNNEEQNRRYEEMLHRIAPSEQKQNPESQSVISAAANPLTYLDLFNILPQLSNIQRMRRAWAAGGDVADASKVVGGNNPLEPIIVKALQPKSVAGDEILSKSKLGITQPEDNSFVKRLMRPFGKTPTAQVIDNVERAIGNLSPYLNDTGRTFDEKVGLLKQIKAAAQGEKMAPEFQAVMKQWGINNSEDFHRVLHAIGKYDPMPVVNAYRRAQGIAESLAQTTRTARPNLYSPEIAGFAKSQAEGMGGYEKVFNHVIDGWKTGKLDVDQMQQGIERVAGIQLTADLTQHFGNTLSEIAKIPPPNAITHIVNTMKRYAGLVFVGGNPASMVNNVITDIATLFRHGGNLRTEAQVDEFFKRVGMVYDDNIGTKVNAAKNTINKTPNAPVDTQSAYGASLPKWIKNVPGLKQVQQGFEWSQLMGRKNARATGFQRWMDKNFVAPKLTPALASHYGAEAKDIQRQLDSAWNYQEALDILMGKTTTWAKYTDELADELTQMFSGVAGKDFPIDANMVKGGLPLHTQQNVNRVLKQARKYVEQGVVPQDAFEIARKDVYGKDTFEDWFPKPPNAPDAAAPTTVSPPPSTPPGGGGAGSAVKPPMTVQQYVDDYMAGKGRGTTPEDLEYQQFAANNAQEIEQEFQRRHKPLPPNERALPKKSPEIIQPTQPTAPDAPTTPRLTPDDIKRQEEAWIGNKGTFDPNTLREFAAELSAEQKLPNILRGQVDPEDWAQMDTYGRTTLLERTLAMRRDAGSFPLSDVYQGKGDVPTAMPDVTDVQPLAPDLSEVLQRALDDGLATTRADNTVMDKHLLAALNKAEYQVSDAPRPFKTVGDIRGREREAMQILDKRKAVKAAEAEAKKAERAARLETAMTERRKALEEAIQMPRHEYPAQLSDNVRDAAVELKFQLNQGAPGRRMSAYNTEEGGRSFMAEGSTNAPFYKELFAKYKTNKPALESALEKIIKDKGADKGVSVERVKEYILKQLAEGLETSAGKMAPDWEARMLLDYPRAQIDEAFDLWEQAQLAAPDVEDVVGTNAVAQFGENITPAKTEQGQMFTQGEDSPLFSGTPQTAKESPFNPAKAQGTQGKMFSTAPEFGAKKATEPIAEVARPLSETGAPASAIETARTTKHHVVYYNGKEIVIDYADTPKQEFSLGGMRINDNAQEGILVTPKGEQYYISRASRKAKRINPDALPPMSEGRMTLDAGEQGARKIENAVDVGKKLPKEYVYHNLTAESLEAIEREGLKRGDFSKRPINYGFGDRFIAVNKSDLPNPQEFQYGNNVAFSPSWEPTMDESTWVTIPADKIYEVDKNGKVIRQLGAGKSKNVGNASDAQVRGFDPNEMHNTSGDYRQRFNDATERMKQAGPQSVLDSKLNAEAIDAMEQMLLDRIGKRYTAEALNKANVLPQDVEQEAMNYLNKAFMPELNTQKQMANAAGRFFQDATVLNYNGQWNIETAMLLERPFVHWWLHTALNYMRDFIDHPALLAFLLNLRNNWDKQSEGMPDRFKGKVPFDMPGSEWFGLGDTIWGTPMRTIMPYEDVLQLNALQRAQYSDSENNDLGSVVNDVFGIHTPIKLGINALTQDWDDFQETFATIPQNRLLKAATNGRLGLESKYDKFYTERAIKELVAEGKITDEQAKVALLTQKGEVWDAVKSRAYAENYGIKELSALFGMRGTPYTPGEQKYNEAQRARENMLVDAVKRFGGNPNMDPEQRYQFLNGRDFYKSDEWQQFKQQYPELEAAEFANKAYGADGERLPQDEAQDARARDYYLDKIGEAYWAAPELKQKLIAADLGDEFKALFLDKNTKNLDAIKMQTVLGWANALDQLLQDPVAGTQLPNPDPYKVTFTTDAQNKAYQTMYDEVQNSYGWQNYYAGWDKYYALKAQNKDAAKQFLNSPEGKKLLAVSDTLDEFFTENPDIQKILEKAGLRKAQTQTQSTTDPRGAALAQAVAASGLNWDTINAKKAEYNKLPKGTGERSEYLSRNPDLLRYFNLTKAIYGEDEEQQSYQSGNRSYQRQSNRTPYSTVPRGRNEPGSFDYYPLIAQLNAIRQKQGAMQQGQDPKVLYRRGQ